MKKVGTKFVCVFSNINMNMYLIISNKKIRSLDFKKAFQIYAKDNEMDDIDEINNCYYEEALEYGLKKLKYKAQVFDFDDGDILYDI
jgi:hypothetical protein